MGQLHILVKKVTISVKILIIIPKTMQNIKGVAPLKIVGKETFGTIPVITYKLRPTGGVINPISMFTVNMMVNQ